MELKPQDLLVLLKAAAHPGKTLTYAELSEALSMSTSEAHASVNRAIVCGLARAKENGQWAIHRPALLEFLLHGVRYVWPAIPGPTTRGIGTSYSTEPLASHIHASPNDALVWALPSGNLLGPSISPIYPTAPQAAQIDPMLHKLLALVDALRTGRARERMLAADFLRSALEAADYPNV